MSKPRNLPPLSLTTCLALLAPAAAAQTGSIVAGTFLGIAYAAGDVDDDGHGDYFVRSAQVWEVRSGATGLPFPFLTRTATNCLTCYYAGLMGDLDADGHDDLVSGDGNGLIQYLSGANGAVLHQYSLPGAFAAALQAVDHDGDGHDDVMVGQKVPSSGSTGVHHFYVLSGRTGAQIFQQTLGYSATGNGRLQYCGDVNGDGHVDLLRITTSYGSPYSVVLAGPQYSLMLTSYSGTTVMPAGDTNADGRDELIVGTDLVDVVTGAVVWAMAPLFPSEQWFSADVDGDGAIDALAQSPTQVGIVYSGRTQTAWPQTSPQPFGGLGDIDADGRDELITAMTLHELQGAPTASFVRDRGAAGTTSAASRPRIRHRLRPRLGDAMLVDLHGAGGPRLAFLAIGSAIDVDLTPFGAPGNRAFVDPLAAPAQLADASGHARYTFSVPNAPILVGVPLSLQWAVIDPAANALGVVGSNALDCVLGN